MLRIFDSEALIRGDQRHITKHSFLARFTPDELDDIEFAKLDNPSAPIELRRAAAKLRSSQLLITVASFINLDLDSLRTGVLMLEAHSLIGVGRALEILDGPISPDEQA